LKASEENVKQPPADSSASTQRSARRARTHRSASGRPVAATVWAGAAGTLYWLAASGEPGAVADAAPWLALASWVVYATQWRPCLRVEGDGFELVNGLRDHRIPFDTVEDVEVGFAVTVRAAGKKYRSWGAPTPPSSFGSGFEHVSDLKSRPQGMLPSNERIRQPEVVTTGRDEIAKAWHDARAAGLAPSNGTVTSTWNRPVIVLGVVAVLWVLAALLI
jgi:hypothetical protein